MYGKLFEAILDKVEGLGLQVDVETVVTDFEEGVMRAVGGVFGRQVISK